MAALRIGTCSWKYDSWRGLVYSEPPKLNHLEEYVKKYNTVEIDQWFWSLYTVDRVSLPRRDVVQAYRGAVPEDFKFTIKIPNSVTLTHFYRKNKADPLVDNPYFFSVDLLSEFLDYIDPLKNHLGPLMFQFEYLNKMKMASQAEFLERFESFIFQCPKDYAYGVEIRNPNYLNDAYFDFLNRNGLCHVFIQGYYMPSIFNIYEKHASAINGTTVIRLHGSDRKGIEEKSGGVWNRILEPKDDDLESLNSMIENLITNQVDVWLNVNNHFEGSAPLTIERIRERLKNANISSE